MVTARPCPVTGCDAELSADEYICRGSARRLAGQLRAIPDLLDELDTTLARMGSTWSEPGEIRGRATGGCKPGCDHAPDNPSCVEGVSSDLNQAAMDAASKIRAVLHGWVRVWDEETPIPTDDGYHGPMCRLGGLCAHASCLHVLGARQAGPRRKVRDRLMASTARQAFLLAAQPLAGRIWAPEVADEISEAVRGAERVLDKPPERQVACTCTCGRPVLAAPGQAIARCPGCGHEWDVEASRAALLAASDDVLETACTISRALDLNARTVRSWASRGRLQVARDDEGKPQYTRSGQPLYRVADVDALRHAGEITTPA